MSETRWTESQLLAMKQRNPVVLVSAAAGSGKTAVLVQRLIDRILQEGADIDQFLVVTFTNAAAQEMRVKIGAALRRQVEHNPGDAHARRQLLLIHQAHILTVHSFCLQLLREHGHRLSLPPDFTVADESRSGALREQTLQQLLEEWYADLPAHPGFDRLVDMVSPGRDDSELIRTVERFYRLLESIPDRQGYLKQMEENYRRAAVDGPADSAWAEEIWLAAVQRLEDAAASLAALQAAVEEEPVLLDKYGPAIAADCDQARALLATARARRWDEMVRQLDGLTHERLRALPRGYAAQSPLAEECKQVRKAWKETGQWLREELFFASEEEVRQDMGDLSPAIAALCRLTGQLVERFGQAKRERGWVDFSDLEQYAVQLLSGEGGQPFALGRAVGGRYREILVDEYQDTNRVQDRLFACLTGGGTPLFLVGDVKQSIYRFRLADPSLFLRQYRRYPPAPGDGPGRRVTLAQNFRSRPAVLQAVNTVCAAIMRREVAELDYTQEEFLYQGAFVGAAPDSAYDSELCVLAYPGNEEEERQKAQWEADYVAGRIAGLLEDGLLVQDPVLGERRPARPEDVVILLRTMANKAAVFQQALERAGIPVQAGGSQGLLDFAESKAVLSALTAVDNPWQDIPLIAALRSPLFALTENDLADIRLTQKDAPFYAALRLWARQDNRGAEILDLLDRLRREAKEVAAWRLIWQLYEQTGALGKYGAMEGGPQRQRNLTALVEQARACCGEQPLFAFLQQVRRMAQRGDDFPAPGQGGATHAVRILSVHQSKGLEFPIVFLADCAKQFNEEDWRQNVRMHSDLGVGFRCVDEERGFAYQSLPRAAIALRARREAVAEEMRVLYVAMTRAKEKLVVTCALPKAADTLARWDKLCAQGGLTPYALGQSRSWALWLIAPLLGLACALPLRRACGLPGRPLDGGESGWRTAYIDRVDRPGLREQAPIREEDGLPPVRVERTYDTTFCTIPSKLTATGLTGDYLAQETAAQAQPVQARRQTFRRPAFAGERRLTGAEIGVAHHLFLQFADFSRIRTVEDAERMRRELVEKKLLTPEQGAAVDVTKIAAFFQGALYRRMQRAGNLRREFKFSLLVPAVEFLPPGGGQSGGEGAAPGGHRLLF